MSLTYPLNVTFKLFALSPEMHLMDASGRNVMTFKQKLFTLREATTVFADQAKTQPLYTLEANQIIGFGAKHLVKHMNGELFASFESDGWGSIWQARYFVRDAAGNQIYHVKEENPWLAMTDVLAGFLDDIPVIGWAAAAALTYFVNPTYIMEDTYGKIRYRMRKQRSIFERRYLLESVDPVPDEWEEFTALALMRLVQLQRREG